MIKKPTRSDCKQKTENSLVKSLFLAKLRARARMCDVKLRSNINSDDLMRRGVGEGSR